MDKTDAIRARDEVLNRMGGHVTALSETAPVRIGFGKIDAVPTGSLSTAVPTPPPVSTFSNGLPGSAPFAPSAYDVNALPDNGNEQSLLPTRALWIGGIPATTSSSALLQIFSPFGPVESARVLVLKVGFRSRCKPSNS